VTTPRQGGSPGELFEQFLAWKQAQDAQSADDGLDVPLFEKLTDGAERSATLPWRHAEPLLREWGWIKDQPAEGDSGNDDQGQGGQASGGARSFFQSLTGGQQQASGPQPKPGQRAPRKAAG
jgi:hypothetical protein